jgi:hypothetical protein
MQRRKRRGVPVGVFTGAEASRLVWEVVVIGVPCGRWLSPSLGRSPLRVW